jgi:disease resistance protein RPM1
VAKACCSLYPNGWVYQPKPLEEHDSKRLFQNRIFGPQNECPGYLKEVSDKILKKCGGLPLAIITISGLLATKAHNGVHSVTKWDQVQTSIGRGLDSIGRGLEIDLTVEGMMRILSHSYFDLPHHLKACLLYLSIFPEDYEIDKKHLVLLWVAEGFVPAESTCTLYESGEKSFIELINRNLILPGKMNERTSEVNSCRVHDTVLDFIVWKSTEDNLVTVVHGIPRLTPPLGMKVRRLNLQGKSRRDVPYTRTRIMQMSGQLLVLDSLVPCWVLDSCVSWISRIVGD